MDAEEKEHFESLLKKQKRRLRLLEERAAIQGFNAPADLIIEIQEIQEAIRKIQLRLDGEDDSVYNSSKPQQQKISSVDVSNSKSARITLASIALIVTLAAFGVAWSVSGRQGSNVSPLSSTVSTFPSVIAAISPSETILVEMTPATINTTSPGSTSTTITGCLSLPVNTLLPTPFAQQMPQPKSDTYLASPSNFEQWEFGVEGWRSKNWVAYSSFRSRAESSISDFIVPDNRKPKEGNYSVCIQSPPASIAPAEFALANQDLPSGEKLRLTFSYRTYGNPDVRVFLTTSGDYNGPYLTAGQPTREKPLPLKLKDDWPEKEEGIDFVVDERSKKCPRLADKWDNWGCVHIKIVVSGEGTVWIDDVWVGKAP